jgi:hypothetical protein
MMSKFDSSALEESKEEIKVKDTENNNKVGKLAIAYNNF